MILFSIKNNTVKKVFKLSRQNFQVHVHVYTTHWSYFSLVSSDFSLFSPEGEVTSPLKFWASLNPETVSIWISFCFPHQRGLDMKYGHNWHSGLRAEVVWKSEITGPWNKDQGLSTDLDIEIFICIIQYMIKKFLAKYTVQVRHKNQFSFSLRMQFLIPAISFRVQFNAAFRA